MRWYKDIVSLHMELRVKTIISYMYSYADFSQWIWIECRGVGGLEVADAEALKKHITEYRLSNTRVLTIS